MYDLRGSNGLAVVSDLLDNVLGVGGPLSINTIFNTTTNGTGIINVRPPNAAVVVNISTLAQVGIHLEAVRVGGLTSWTDFDPLAVKGPISMLTTTHSKNFSLAVQLRINVTSTGELASIPLVEDFTLTLRLTNCTLRSWFDVQIKDPAQGTAPSATVPPACYVPAVRNATMKDLVFEMDVDVLDFNGTAASGGVLEEEIDIAVNTLFKLLTVQYRGAVPAFFNAFVSQPIMKAVNPAIAAKIANETFPCVPPEPASTLFAPVSLGIATAASAAVVICIYVVASRRADETRGDRLFKQTSFSSPGSARERMPLAGYGGAGSLNGGPLGGGRYGDDYLGFGDGGALMFSPKLPWIARGLLPVVVLYTIAVFLISNTSNGASVGPVVTTGDDNAMVFAPLFNFKLANSVKDMWQAGVYPLSLLVAGFSGAWPYLKLMMMLGCWTLPVARVPSALREKWLMALDALGKWSLIDIYVMVMMMVAFKFTFAGAGLPGPIPGQNITASMDIYVVPEFGFRGFLVCTVGSLVASHVMLHYHRVEAATASIVAGGDSVSVSRYRYPIDPSGLFL